MAKGLQDTRHARGSHRPFPLRRLVGRALEPNRRVARRRTHNLRRHTMTCEAHSRRSPQLQLQTPRTASARHHLLAQPARHPRRNSQETNRHLIAQAPVHIELIPQDVVVMIQDRQHRTTQRARQLRTKRSNTFLILLRRLIERDDAAVVRTRDYRLSTSQDLGNALRIGSTQRVVCVEVSQVGSRESLRLTPGFSRGASWPRASSAASRC